jgi:hypothetical protein
LRAAGSQESSVNGFDQKDMGLTSFLTLSRWSFSTLAVKSVMEALAVRFLLSTAAVPPTLPFDKCLYRRSRQGLVMAGLYNFLNLLKLFLAGLCNFMNSL